MMTIDQLGIVKIKHLQSIHKLGSYRNACKIVNQLSAYTNQTYYNKEKVVYLNKKGRDLIGAEKEINGISQAKHYLLRNEVYLHFDSPIDWINEYTFEVDEVAPRSVDIIVQGLKPSNKKKVVCDALFTRNGYTHIIEIDNTRDMIDNRKKVNSYAEILPLIRKDFKSAPILYFFTHTQDRKKKLSAWLKDRGIRHEVLMYDEMK